MGKRDQGHAAQRPLQILVDHGYLRAATEAPSRGVGRRGQRRRVVEIVVVPEFVADEEREERAWNTLFEILAKRAAERRGEV